MSVLVVAGLVAACGAADDSDQSTESAKRPPRTCGNGAIDTGEQCDGRNLNGATCATATMGARPTGSLSCSKQCTFNTKGCKGGGAGGAGGTGGQGGGGGV
ncbi:MAG TPA: hypothetical protein VI072_20620 [Polyangiaceae bacterium]